MGQAEMKQAVVIQTAESQAAVKPTAESQVAVKPTAGSGMPRVLLAAPASSSGKTVITCGLLRALQKRGLECVSFKCGPDYIDPLFHQAVLGIAGSNLDSFFLEEKQLRDLFAEKTTHTQLAIIEGVMGYYDGMGGTSTWASSYEIARITETPVILIVDGKKSSLSIAALIQGFKQFREDSRICGVILNRTTASMAERLKPCLEAQEVALLGAVPDCAEARIESRHLGLTLPDSRIVFREQLEQLAEKLETCLDIQQIITIARAAVKPIAAIDQIAEKVNAAERKTTTRSEPKQIRRIGIAKDEAFCFYYQENLDFLAQEGYQLVPFSPLHDRKLPGGLTALLLGGGYPELYARQLAENETMLNAVRQAAEAGIKILAECGGFLYLHQTLEDDQGQEWPLAGVIPAKGFRTGRLSRFGYIQLENQTAGNSMQERREHIRGHEFHYWDSTAPGTDMLARKPASERTWVCMYRTEKLLAGFPHLYYRSDPDFICRFLKQGGESCCN